jgi:hypothetical protein
VKIVGGANEREGCPGADEKTRRGREECRSESARLVQEPSAGIRSEESAKISNRIDDRDARGEAECCELLAALSPEDRHGSKDADRRY